jgi:mRNA interferase MazF
MTLQAGEVWLADIPYTHGQASKVRPVLVLWLDGLDAVVAVITSAAPRSTTDVPLADWKAAGLRVASTVRLSRLDCLEQPLLFRRLGSLLKPDADQIKTTGGLHIKPQF